MGECNSCIVVQDCNICTLYRVNNDFVSIKGLHMTLSIA